MPGSEAVFSNCCTAEPSIQFFGDAITRTSAVLSSLNQFPFV
jgi:hypothetical protein